MDQPNGASEGGKRLRGQSALRIYDALRQEILTLSLPPGELLDEVAIAQRFDVSRSPVREALIRLSSDGLVKTLPNKSTMVAPLTVEDYPRYHDALELLQRATTRLAARHRTEADLDRIRRAQAVYEAAVESGDVPAMIERNRDFHIAVAEAGRNPYFTQFYTRLLDEGRRMLRIYFLALDDHPPPEITGEHDRIIDAIAAQDADAAERIAHQHAVQVSDHFLRYLAERRTEEVKVEQGS